MTSTQRTIHQYFCHAFIRRSLAFENGQLLRFQFLQRRRFDHWRRSCQVLEQPLERADLQLLRILMWARSDQQPKVVARTELP